MVVRVRGICALLPTMRVSEFVARGCVRVSLGGLIGHTHGRGSAMRMTVGGICALLAGMRVSDGLGGAMRMPVGGICALLAVMCVSERGARLSVRVSMGVPVR